MEQGELRREVAEDNAMTDVMADLLEHRVLAVEKVLAARWPRRWLLAARLRRDLRWVARTYSWAGPDFADRQAEYQLHLFLTRK
jgi:hypothetical protein